MDAGLLARNRVQTSNCRNTSLAQRKQTDRLELLYYCIVCLYMHFCSLVFFKFWFMYFLCTISF